MNKSKSIKFQNREFEFELALDTLDLYFGEYFS
jgi:hypothetical protein